MKVKVMQENNKNYSNKKNKIFIVGGRNTYGDYINWITPLNIDITDSLDEAGIVFFAGGSDVNPALYNENKNPRVYYSTQRDKIELEIFQKSIDKYKVGVCRGGQFLTVMAGYKLVQHMAHPAIHDIYTVDNKILEVTSSHHNQFLLQPNGLVNPINYKLIGWTEKLSPWHYNGDNEDYRFSNNYQEPEIVYYDNKSLAIQMHPEWFDLNHPTVEYCQSLLLQFLEDKITTNKSIPMVDACLIS